ncbi:hypothetical protein [uncultured Pseudoalteromonas sp.]|uniref:hypothetical protein n=1 Tax=uncultured Pseudoalteromonas sp. TaxID=114053 RepID=UPI0032B1B4BA
MDFTYIPFDVLKKNKIPQLWDAYIINQLETNENFDEIIKGNDLLSRMAVPAARKEIAKTIYSRGLQPNLIKQKFVIKEVMGSVGEALTELLLPDKDVSVNNTGYDVDYCGNYIEVKSTVTDKALMSNIQYRTANYLIVHKFDKSTGKYCSSLLAPLPLIHSFKPKRDKSVSVSTKTDSWARGLKITLTRILLYFEKDKKVSVECNKNICRRCHSSILVDGEVKLQKLAVSCKGCSWENWEDRYFYYYYKFCKERNLSINETAIFTTIHQFLIVENNEKREISSTSRVELITKEGGQGLYFCPSLSVTRKPKKQINIVYDFTHLLQYLSEALNDGKDIREFYIYSDNKKVECMVRSHLAPIKPGFYEEEFALGFEPQFITRSLGIVSLVFKHLMNET